MRNVCRKGGVLVLLAAAALLFIALGLASNALAEANDQKASAAESPDVEINSVKELAGKKIGVVTGTVFDQIVLEDVKGVSKDDILYFNSNAECVGALQAGKVDAFISDLPIAQLATGKNEGIGVMPEIIEKDQYGFVLPKNSPHTQELNERLKAYKEDGTLDRLKKKWMGSDDSKKTMPDQDWPAPKGTLTVAISPDNEPVNYIVGNRICGLCIEILETAARDLGYDVQYRNTNVNAVLAEVQSGKSDIGADSFSITEERKKMMDMTEPYYDGGVVAVVRTKGNGTGESGGFFENLARSFERTFIVENRWQLILDGLGVTLIISVSSGVLGLGLGFVFVLLRRKKEDGIASKLIRLLENLLGGLPVVVVLMLLYYVVFGAIDVPGAVVAILAFTLLFGATCGSIMWNAIQAVDVGQTEAGRALGFGDRDTFFLVVLPQAARQFAPLLVGQFVSLVKDTSIVGYITVQDLTRVGDIIRSRTMEAFFPLIAIAVIYFVLCRLMAWLLNKFAVRRFEPKDGPRTIKGVDLQ